MDEAGVYKFGDMSKGEKVKRFLAWGYMEETIAAEGKERKVNPKTVEAAVLE
jgi:hypothetical protein